MELPIPWVSIASNTSKLVLTDTEEVAKGAENRWLLLVVPVHLDQDLSVAGRRQQTIIIGSICELTSRDRCPRRPDPRPDELPSWRLQSWSRG